MVSFHVITPTEYKALQVKFKIFYAFHSSPFGKCLIGITSTDKAVLHLSFVDKTETTALKILKEEWPLSVIEKDVDGSTEEIVHKIFSKDDSVKKSLNVLLKGTEFQTKVWQSLVNIPPGQSVTYEDVARLVNNPKAIRAVGNVMAKNTVGYLIPCHRVKGKNSDKYTWGLERKRNMLEYETTCQ